MQRIVREDYSFYSSLENLDGKISLIRKHFPPSLASYFAHPRKGVGDKVEWWSPLGGQPIPYAQLSDEKKALLLEEVEQRKNSLKLLIDEFEKRNKTEAVSALSDLLGEPDLNHLYSINDAPVLVRWGPPPSAPVKADPVVTKPSSPVNKVNVSSTRRERKLSYKWLLLPFLFLLLLALIWVLLFFSNYSKIPVYACQPDNVESPEFVTVFDTSGSMMFNLQTSIEEERWFFNAERPLLQGNERAQRILAEPTRITIAKNSLDDMINGLHDDIDTRLITFNGCKEQPDHGIYKSGQRNNLLMRIRGLEPDNGTPLAASLAYAASKVDGRNRDAMIVMFIDGEDSCGGDVCAVAKKISESQPRLSVNVVDIGSAGAPSCISKYTGGRMYKSDDVKKISDMLKKATREISAQSDCS